MVLFSFYNLENFMILALFALVTFSQSEIVQFEKYRLHEGTVIFDKSGDDKGFIEIDTDDGVEPWGGNSSSPSLSVFPSGYE